MVGRIPDELAREVQIHLDGYGVHGDFRDLEEDEPIATTLTTVNGDRLDVEAMYAPVLSLRSTRLASDVSSDRLLVLTHHVHPSTAEPLRAAGIWFADESGNTFMRASGLVIDVRGRPRARVSTGRASQVVGKRSTTLFTPKRAQIVAALLSSPELVSAALRDIAHHSGTSVGLAKSTVDDLVEVGFIEQHEDGRHPHSFEQLLDMWLSAFPIGLAESLTLFVGEGDLHPVVPDGVVLTVSGEQATGDLIRNAPTLTAYVELEPGQRLPTELIRANRWQTSDLPNIILRRKFWRDLPEFRTGCAPAPLVIADLMATGEGRQREAAQEVRREWSASRR
uniref:type IV toxin-antitoxin system AbiEi family antitoxin n=1 Tax=Gordonia sp. B7-2 TaxID=3420932 RepID=UPI003D8B3F97